MRGMVRDVLEFGSSLGYLDELYETYQETPGQVDESWYELLADRPAQANGNGHSAGDPAVQDTGARPDGHGGLNGSQGNGQAAREITLTTRIAPALRQQSTVTMSPISALP